MSKNLVIKLLCILFTFSLIFSGCAVDKPVDSSKEDSKSSSSSSEETPDIKEMNKGKKLTVLIGATTLSDAHDKLFDSFENEIGITVDLQVVPGATDQYNQIVQSKIATKDFPDILIYFTTNSSLASLNPEENVVELTNQEWISRAADGVFAMSGSYKGKLYGMPFGGVDFTGLIYNEDIFDRLSLEAPTDFESLVEVSQKIKDAGITPIYEMGKQGGPLRAHFMTELAAHIKETGDEFSSKINSNQIAYEDTPILGALEQKMELQNKGFFNMDDFMSGTWDTMFAALADEKAAMSFVFSNMIPVFYNNYPDVNINMVPLNGVASTMCIQAMYIMKTPNVDSANQFVDYFLKPETLTPYFSELKAIPSYKGVEVELSKPYQTMSNYYQDGNFSWQILEALIIEPGFVPTMQQMHQGELTPLEATKKLTETSRQLGKERNIPGFS